MSSDLITAIIDEVVEEASKNLVIQFTKSTRVRTNKKRQTLTLNIEILKNFIKEQTLATTKVNKKQKYKYLDNRLSEEEITSFETELNVILSTFDKAMQTVLQSIKIKADAKFKTKNNVYSFNNGTNSTGIGYYVATLSSDELKISLELIYNGKDYQSISFDAIRELYMTDVKKLWEAVAIKISQINFQSTTKKGKNKGKAYTRYAITRKKLGSFLSSENKAATGHDSDSTNYMTAIGRILQTLATQIQNRLAKEGIESERNEILKVLKFNMYIKYLPSSKRSTTNLIVQSSNANSKAGATFEIGLYNKIKGQILNKKALRKLLRARLNTEKKLIEKTFSDGLTSNRKVKIKATKYTKEKGTRSKIKQATVVPNQVNGSSKNKQVKLRTPKLARPNQPKATKSAISLNDLKAQINARLSMTVIKNMGTPALENRTGRFARSAQVTDVRQTSKGFPSIGYTYQKFPYQTFEPGFKQGSVDRDPRTLIDRSIREIAREFIEGRFYTRGA